MQEQDSKQNVIKRRSFMCQACQSSQKDIKLCKYCLSVNCKQCRNGHNCSIFEGSCRRSSKLISFNPKDFELSKQRWQNSLAKAKTNMQDQKSQRVERQALILCNRCSVKEASGECKKCKIKYYCNSCFNDIHSSPKLSKHQHVAIEQSYQIQENCQGSFLKLPLRQQDLSQQHINIHDLMKKPSEAVLAIQANLIIMRSRLQINKTAKICQLNQTIHSISSILQSLIKRIKEKQQQIMLFLAQSQKSFLQSYGDMEKALNHEGICVQNLKLMRAYHKQSKQADRKSSISEQFCINMKAKIESDSLDNIDLRFQDISKQCMLFQQKLHKITLKRSLFQLNRIKDLSLVNSSTQDTPRCQIKSKKQQKLNKKSANHSSCKSLSKFHPTAFYLTSPKKMMCNSMKTSNQSSNVIIESIVSENCKEKVSKEPKFDKINNNLYLNNGLKNKTQNDDGPNQQSYIDTILSPSIKRSKRNSQNNPYQLLGNYGKYVEKAKKRSKQMKADIIQLTKFAYFSSVTNNENKR